MFDDVLTFVRVKASSLAEQARFTLYNLLGIAVEEATGQEVYQALGVIGRPLPPTNGPDGRAREAEGIAARTADGVVVFGFRDERLHENFPHPKDGDIGLAGYGNNFVKFAADGTVALCTSTDGTADGQLIQFQLNPAGPSGEPAGFVLTGPFGKLTYDVGGFHLLHHTGAKLDLGGIGGLPAPISALGSYATITAAIAKIKSSAIVLGPDGGTAEQVAKALALQTVLASIQTSLTATAAALTAIGTALTGLGAGGAAGAIAAAVAAITATGVAVGAGAATIPSQSTSVT